MSDIQRYAPWPQEWPQEDPDGDLVEYEDHKKIVDALQARAEQLAATNERLEAALEAAKAYIEDLEAHEGAEGFSLSTAILSSAYYAALKGADHE